jgi:amidohydrolase
VNPSVPTGSVSFTPGIANATACEFFIKVRGRASHGAHPDKGIDALLPACAMVTSLQSIITRRIDPVDAALITVGQFSAGAKNNTLADEVVFSGIIRTLDMENSAFLKKEFERLCVRTAEAYNASCDVRFQDSYPSLVNDDHLLTILKDVGEEALGKEHVLIAAKPSLGADDFAYFCHETKGIYFNLGTGSAAGGMDAPLHSAGFCPDEACMKTGILMEALGALRVMAYDLLDEQA